MAQRKELDKARVEKSDLKYRSIIWPTYRDGHEAYGAL